jgi:hypothetical protein
VHKSENIREQSYIIDTERVGLAIEQRYDDGDSYALLWMLYAAYKRTAEVVNVQIPKVRACNGVTEVSC